MKKYVLTAGLVIFSINAWGAGSYNNEKTFYKNKTGEIRDRGEKGRHNDFINSVNGKSTDSSSSVRRIRLDSRNHIMYIDGKLESVNFKSINKDQRDIFQKYFKNRNFQTQTEITQYTRKYKKKFQYKWSILSLGLKNEELDKISIHYLELLKPTGDLEVKGWDIIAKDLERPILIVEYKNGNISGFYEYGKEFSEDRRKIILIDGINRKQLVDITDQSISSAGLNMSSSSEWTVEDSIDRMQIDSDDDSILIPARESELRENEKRILELSGDQYNTDNDTSAFDADLSSFSSELVESDEIFQNRMKDIEQNWFNVVKRGDLNQLIAWSKDPFLYIYNEYIDAADDEGNTAIMLAIKANKADIVKFFLEQKADIFTLNKNGESALTLAEKSDNETIVGYFEKYNAMSVTGKIGDVQLEQIPIAHKRITKYRDVLYGDFVGRRFEITDKGSDYEVEVKIKNKGSVYQKYFYQSSFCSLGLTDEEEAEIPMVLREYVHKCGGIFPDDKGLYKNTSYQGAEIRYDIRKYIKKDVWSEIADILQYRILIYEYNDRDKGDDFGKIIGFYEYGAQYAAKGTKRILLSRNNRHYLNLSDITPDIVSQGISEGGSLETNQTSQMEVDTIVDDTDLFGEAETAEVPYNNINSDQTSQMEVDTLVNDSVLPEESITSSSDILAKVPQLFEAVKKGDAAFVKHFIEKYDEFGESQALFDRKDENGTPLLVLAIKNSNIRQQYDLMNFLLEHVQNVNAKDAENFTILMRAVQYADEDIIHFLVDLGANIEETDKEGRTAFLLAKELKRSLEREYDIETVQNKKRELKKEIERYERIIEFIEDYFKKQEREKSTKDIKREKKDKIDVIQRYGQENVNLVVEEYNKLPVYTERARLVVDSKIKTIDINGVSVIFTYARNNGLLVASEKAKKLKNIIYRARKSGRWTDRGIANRYKIRDYDVRIVTHNMPQFRIFRVSENMKRTEPLSNEEKEKVRNDYLQGYLSDYGICCKYHINQEELDIIKQEEQIPINVLEGKESENSLKEAWQIAVHEWLKMSFSSQERLKAIVDIGYRPKIPSDEYIKKFVGECGEGVEEERFEQYMSGMIIQNVQSSGWYLLRLIRYMFAREIGQMFYKEKNSKEFEEICDMLKEGTSKETVGRGLKAIIGFWKNASLEQKVSIVKESLKEDEKLLKKWRFFLTNMDKKRKELLGILNNEGFKPSDFGTGTSRSNKGETSQRLLSTLISAAKRLKKIIEYIIDNEKLILTDNDIINGELLDKKRVNNVLYELRPGDCVGNFWFKIVGVWLNMSFYSQEKLKAMVDLNYKPKIMTDKYIEELVGNGGNGVEENRLNNYISDMRTQRTKSPGKALLKLIRYMFARKLNQIAYNEQGSKRFEIAYDIMEKAISNLGKEDKAKLEEQLSPKYWNIAVKFWVSANREQRVKLSKIALESDKKLLKKWGIIFANIDKESSELFKILKANDFKRSDFFFTDRRMKNAKDQIDEKFCKEQQKVAGYLKQIIQYIIDNEELKLTDDKIIQADSVIEQEGISEELVNELSDEASSQSGRKRKADQSSTSSVNETQQSSSRKKVRKSKEKARDRSSKRKK